MTTETKCTNKCVIQSVGKKYWTNEITDPPNPHQPSMYCLWWDYEESYSSWKRKEMHKGQIWTDSKWEMGSHFTPFLLLRFCPLKQAEQMWGPHTQPARLWAPMPAVGAASPVHGAQHPCGLQLQGHSTQPTQVPGGHCSTSVLQSCSVGSASSPHCYGLDRNSFIAAEPIALKDRNSYQMTQDIVLRQTRSNFPMFSFKCCPFNKQSGFFQCLKSHGLNICMQLLQHQLFQLCLSSAAALSKYWQPSPTVQWCVPRKPSATS